MPVLQIITALFALTLAWLNSVPVRGMIKNGAKDWESHEFHFANGLTKCFWALTVAYLHGGGLLHQSIVATVLFLVQWLLFDVALNLFVGNDWFYLGQKAWFDRTFKNGKVKAAVVVVILVALNIWLLRLR